MLAAVAPLLVGAMARTRAPVVDGGPALVNTCLITTHVGNLVDFYKRVLQLEPRTVNPSYAEFA